MSAFAQYAAFAGVMLVVSASPGPDLAVIMGRALSGWAAGAAATLGVAAGMFLWVLAAVTGVSALLATSTEAFTAVRLLGAAYLIYLGVHALVRVRRAHGDPDTILEPVAAQGFRRDLLRGFGSSMLNPKTAVFFVALIPQFIPDGASAADAVVLPLVAVVVVTAWFLFVTSVVTWLHARIAQARTRRRIDTGVGVALVTVGVGVALH
ncbi:threonine/homoserine/homoserine lactone efflux protein [Nocardia tenerifensis]|uniref:Threonine/homoserine/homoserine lactone efflux protein n=1 Tax=Nocardia tenerifensis TaxID=228006 RepID=A0A318KBJ8_9NOCA|nr:LysE family translocator [Nocardia tenerifensis]PXX68876.1 threonine/homoserine/homoserine lactone efflux protein [Nocardia tenerifensis]